MWGSKVRKIHDKGGNTTTNRSRIYALLRLHNDKIEDNDLKQENVVIDTSSLEILKGSKVDFSEELIGDSFKISNPKTKTSCGCGISFSF